jgi:hypothetical protein
MSETWYIMVQICISNQVEHKKIYWLLDDDEVLGQQYREVQPEQVMFNSH